MPGEFAHHGEDAVRVVAFDREAVGVCGAHGGHGEDRHVGRGGAHARPVVCEGLGGAARRREAGGEAVGLCEADHDARCRRQLLLDEVQQFPRRPFGLYGAVEGGVVEGRRLLEDVRERDEGHYEVRALQVVQELVNGPAA